MFPNQLGNIHTTLAIALQWFFVIYPHIAAQAKKNSVGYLILKIIYSLAKYFIKQPVVYFLSNLSSLKNSSNIYIIRHIITKIIGIQFYCGTNFLNTLYCGRPWPAAYINIIQNTHQIQVLTEALCRAQAIFYWLPNNEWGTKYRGLTYSAK